MTLSKLARLAHCIRALQRTEALEIYHLSVFHRSVYRLSRIYPYYKELAQVITESEKSQEVGKLEMQESRCVVLVRI